MSVETSKNNHHNGFIEVICGCMFSGKTNELISRVSTSGIEKQKIGLFKPSVDVRYHADNIVSHDAHVLEAKPLQEAMDILDHADDLALFAIDEAQFFGQEIVGAIEQLANQGKRVIIAGLDMDYMGRPFGPMPALLSIANHVTKLHAQCEQCGDEARFSYRKTSGQEQVLLGEKNEYEARCRTCYNLK